MAITENQLLPTPSLPAAAPQKKQLPPWLAGKGFKKGVSGNPRGRPTNVLSKHERLILLSKAARTNILKANAVEAIKEINKMMGDVASDGGNQDNRTINFIVAGEFKELMEGIKKRLLETVTPGEVKHNDNAVAQADGQENT